MVATTTAEENERIVRHLVAVFNETDLDAYEEMFAEDVIDHTPFGETRGRGAVRDLADALHSAFADFSFVVEELVAEGDTVALRATERGVHEGEFMGIEPTGREIEIGIMDFLHVEDGEIVERWIQPDVMGLMRQLGVVEPPGE